MGRRATSPSTAALSTSRLSSGRPGPLRKCFCALFSFHAPADPDSGWRAVGSARGYAHVVPGRRSAPAPWGSTGCGSCWSAPAAGSARRRWRARFWPWVSLTQRRSADERAPVTGRRGGTRAGRHRGVCLVSWQFCPHLGSLSVPRVLVLTAEWLRRWRGQSGDLNDKIRNSVLLRSTVHLRRCSVCAVQRGENKVEDSDPHPLRPF